MKADHKAAIEYIDSRYIARTAGVQNLAAAYLESQAELAALREELKRANAMVDQCTREIIHYEIEWKEAG